MKLISENPKASLTVLASAIATVLVWVLSLFGVIVPVEVSKLSPVASAGLTANEEKVAPVIVGVLLAIATPEV